MEDAKTGPKYDDESAIREIYSKARTRAQAERSQFERNWFRNILYFCGIQWIVYHLATKRWMPRIMKKWVPRPVTNKFAMHARTMIQILTAKPPAVSMTPHTDNADDVASAEVANGTQEVIYREAETDTARKLSAAWRVFTGNAFLHPCYDPDPQYGMAQIPHFSCPACGKRLPEDQLGQNLACPDCGSPMQPAMDETGVPIVEEVPRGKLRLEVFSPFETFLDMESRDMASVNEIMTRRRYPVDWINKRWPQPLGEEIQPDSGESEDGGGMGQNLLRAVAYAAASNTAAGYGGGKSPTDDLNATVDTLWKRPCEEFPEGLCAIFCHDKLLNPQELKIPYRDEDDKPIWPWHHTEFDHVPGRMLGATRLDDLAPLQETRNRHESELELCIMRMAAPGWMVPRGAGFIDHSGEPGAMLEYDATDPKLKPEQYQGLGPNPVLVNRIAQLDEDMEQIAGTFDVLKGSAPTGVTAGSALRLLLERAVTQFTPALEDFEQVWAGCVKDLLLIAKQFWAEARFAKNQGPGQVWEVKRFLGSRITGGVDVEVEAGSSIPKNSVGTQALIQDLGGMGAINPQDPETQYEILREFGMTKLLGSSDDTIRHAQREEWDFFNEGKPPQLDLIVDNHQIHLISHRRRAMQSDFKTLPEPVQAIFKQHIQETQEVVAAMMMPPPNPDEQDQGAKKKGASPERKKQSSMPEPAGGSSNMIM